MTRYEKLKEEKENFLRAAKNAVNKFMEKLWKQRANDVQERINKLTVAEAATKII